MHDDDHAAARPPIAAIRPVATVHHGVTITDSYGWLRADNWQKVMRDPSVLDPEIRNYLEAENAYTEAALADTKDLQETLFQEMKARLKEDDSQVPTPHGPYDYFPRFVKGGQYAQVCRMARGRPASEAQVLLDGNAEAKGKKYWSLGGSDHSPDHKLMAYATDDKGSELYTIKIRDLATGQDLADEISDTRGSMAWARWSPSFTHLGCTRRRSSNARRSTSCWRISCCVRCSAGWKRPTRNRSRSWSRGPPRRSRGKATCPQPCRVLSERVRGFASESSLPEWRGGSGATSGASA